MKTNPNISRSSFGKVIGVTFHDCLFEKIKICGECEEEEIRSKMSITNLQIDEAKNVK